jgi:hypothetical protein
MIEILEGVTNADIAGAWSILRSTGTFAAGGWEANPPTTIQAYGPVRNATNREMEILDIADRITQVLTFRSYVQLNPTSEDLSQTSDVLLYNGEKYRIISTRIYADQGYWLAFASRMQGS